MIIAKWTLIWPDGFPADLRLLGDYNAHQWRAEPLEPLWSGAKGTKVRAGSLEWQGRHWAYWKFCPELGLSPTQPVSRNDIPHVQNQEKFLWASHIQLIEWIFIEAPLWAGYWVGRCWHLMNTYSVTWVLHTVLTLISSSTHFVGDECKPREGTPLGKEWQSWSSNPVYVSSISLELLDTMFLSFYLVCVLEES